MNPRQVVFLSTLFWIVIFLISPLEVEIEVNTIAVLFYIISFISFLLGSLTLDRKSLNASKVNHGKTLKVFYINLIFSFIGVLFRFIDRYLLRGIAIQNDFLENRSIMEEESGNVFGILGSLFLPSIYIVVFLQVKYKILNSILSKVTIYLLLLFPIVDSILLGSRSNIFILFVFVLFILIYFKKINFSVFKITLLSSVLIGFFIFMSYMFINRTSVIAGDAIYEVVLDQSNINYTVTGNKNFKEYFDNQSDLLKPILLSYVITTQYIVHGVFEFSYLYSNFNEQFTYGGYTFLVYKRFFFKVLSIPLDTKEVYSVIPRTGVYTTLLGPLYIDFGWFSILFMFIFGRYYQLFYKNSVLGDDISILLLLFFALVIYFAPIFNFINGAGGIFLFTNFIINYILTKIKIV